ncbi:lipid kinase [Amorphus orientalis]|uniref:YegS/Rv2252/BmrU family lipid kinase n=1 Tax=Amorphus orientalis TaxID=649198 RepID=A0AAE3VL58_9HYPH|nr:lipid kinase [Amorphus orientalis]MDQ0313928.1 YegS/Rv2252/BmrU family lipid kinase [Amorphus orientalis]
MDEALSTPPASERNRRALLLLNPKARKGSDSVDEALALFRRNGIELVEASVQDYPGSAEAIEAHASDVDLVIIGGGDGSLNKAAAGLARTGLPFGILPLGTANDLARTLQIPFSIREAAEVIIDGRERRLDLGIVNDLYFFNVASIGFSATLARLLTSEAKKRWGVLGYAISAVRLAAQSRTHTVTIHHDGITESVRTIQVTVGNGRHYGGGLTVDDTAEPDDGRLDVYSLEVRHWTELIALVPSLYRGTQKHWKNVRTFSTTEVTLETRHSHDVSADGDLLTTTPARFGIAPKAVRAIVPRSAPDHHEAGVGAAIADALRS